MSKLLKICMVVAAVLSFTGCYNDFDDPAPAKVWTEADFSAAVTVVTQGKGKVAKVEKI